MATVADRAPLGTLLRDWQRRRLSQLELALEAGVSARHLSLLRYGARRHRRRARDRGVLSADKATAAALGGR